MDIAEIRQFTLIKPLNGGTPGSMSVMAMLQQSPHLNWISGYSANESFGERRIGEIEELFCRANTANSDNSVISRSDNRIP
jgi:hypothetical protein